MHAKNEISSKSKNIKLILKVIYDIYEKYGISKEVISLFILFERRIWNEQNL